MTAATLTSEQAHRLTELLALFKLPTVAAGAALI